MSAIESTKLRGDLEAIAHLIEAGEAAANDRLAAGESPAADPDHQPEDLDPNALALQVERVTNRLH